MIRRIAIAIATAALLLSVTSLATAQSPVRSITKVTGDVYRFRNNNHYALVVVTDNGVVVVDPINADAATWLKTNLKQITDTPITHLIYSHSHGDHASGGQALDAKIVIAHANAPAAIDGVTPDIRFDDTRTLEIGGKTFTLVWLGEGHATDLITVVVQPENVAFITDAASPKRLPYRDFPRSNIDGWIDQIRKIETLDFKIFVPAHGNVGVKADATDARIYMEKLRQRVLDGLKAGKSVDDLAATVTMDEYKDWQQYAAWRELNVRGMARFLKESGQVN
jgi:glyoxylase-like metal-dependent hydrolase (beta-lactamase superfamily II)